MSTASRSKYSAITAVCAAAWFAFSAPARAEFETLWMIGFDDGSQADFTIEGGQNDVSVGDPFLQDDDYFFAGNYGGFVGNVTEDELWTNFDRALTPGDPRNRLHFILTADQAAAATQFNLIVDFIQLGGGSIHDVVVYFNDNEIWSENGIDADRLVDEIFSAGSVAAVAGENIVTIERIGGGANNPWIQFDYIELRADTDPSSCAQPVCEFKASPTFAQPGQPVTLTWIANINSTLEISGVGNVDSLTTNGLGTTTVMPAANTVYTITATNGGDVATIDAFVDLDIITSFTGSGAVPGSAPVARPGQPVTLSWVLADPTATVEIDNGIGDVTGLTVGGMGSIELSGALAPEFDTFYTLTATRAGDIDDASVDVLVSENVLVWEIGSNDGGVGGFDIESFVPNEPPGDPFIKDDDYYFAGDYTDFDDLIGLVTEDEPWIQFERAITSGDPNNRLHFILTQEQAAPGTFLFLDVDMIAGGHPGGDTGPAGAFGVHDVVVRFNDVELVNEPGITSNTLFELMFTAASVNAQAGHNFIEVSRPGGDSAGTGQNSGWIQFDYLRLEANTDPASCAEPICTFSASKTVIQPGESVTLNWFASPTATLTIDNGVGSVDGMTTNGLGSIALMPTNNATYTLTANDAGTIDTAEVTVGVALVNSFLAGGAVPLASAVARPGQPAVLHWNVDPAAGVTVSIDQGVGNVTASTVDGVGSVQVNPAAPTTYTLTATRGSDVVTATANVAVSDWQLLFQVGNDDNSQADFTIEGGSNEPPGDPFSKDDDMYTVGDFTSLDPFVGLVTEPEPWVNYDRALTGGDPNNRIHFVMTPEQAAEDKEIRLRVDLYDGPADHDIIVTFNGIQVYQGLGITAPTLIDETFTAGSVGAVAGPNVVEVSKSGGSGAYIQFDWIIGEVRGAGDPGVGTGFLITGIDPDLPIGDVTLTWRSEADKSYRIESSVLMQAWDPESTGIASQGATTTATVNVGIPAPPDLNFRVVEE